MRPVSCPGHFATIRRPQKGQDLPYGDFGTITGEKTSRAYFRDARHPPEANVRELDSGTGLRRVAISDANDFLCHSPLGPTSGSA
jgi:hypothetical protein